MARLAIIVLKLILVLTTFHGVLAATNDMYLQLASDPRYCMGIQGGVVNVEMYSYLIFVCEYLCIDYMCSFIVVVIDYGLCLFYSRDNTRTTLARHSQDTRTILARYSSLHSRHKNYVN